MERLCVLYDEQCGFCCECARWLAAEPHLVPLVCVPRQSPEAIEAFGDLDKPGSKPELIVVDSDGGVYRDSDAWIVVLWALERYRSWSVRLVKPLLRPFARSLFELVSNNRLTVSKLLSLESDVVVQQRLLLQYGDPWAPRCVPEACRTPRLAG